MSGRGRNLRPGGVVRALLRFFLLVVLGFGAGLVIGVVSEEPELLAGHLRGESTSVSLSARADGSIGAEGFVVAEGFDGAEGSFKAEGSAGASGPSVERVEVNRATEADTEFAGVASPNAPAATSRSAAVSPPTPAVPARLATQPARVAENAGQREAKPPKVSAPPQVRKQAAVPPGAFAIQVGAFSDERAAQGLARGLDQKGYPATILPSLGSGRRFRVRVQPFADEAAAQAMAGRLKKDEGLPTWVLRMEPETGSGRGAR